MITWIIIGTTVLISYLSFQNPTLMYRLKYNAAYVVHNKEYYRLITHAFVHANWTHLGVNMLVLFFFGRNVEVYFAYYFGNRATLYYILLYLGGILVSNIWSLLKQKDNYDYNALGASGAVSAVLFAAIFFDPWRKLYFYFAIPIPGILFAIAYLGYSYWMSKQQKDNVAHDAHLLGAVFGFIFPVLLKPVLLDNFINNLFSFL